MTRAEILGGLSGIAFVSAGYFAGMVLLDLWGAPGFGYLLAIALGFGAGVAGGRLRAR
jgi:hypothetical protein